MKSVPNGRYTKEFREEAGKLVEVGKNQKPLSEVELELARVRKELAEVKIERDLLKKQPRTLRRSRCQIRDNT